jgi:uncharacterized protein DUF6056
LGPVTPRFIPGLLVTLWFVGTVWASYQLHSLARKVSWASVVLYAGFIIVATLEAAPNVAQSLYWQTGALTYVAPLVLLSFYVGVIGAAVRERHNNLSYRLNLLYAGTLTFVAGGFSDAYVVLQSCGLTLCVLVLEIVASEESKSRLRHFLIVGLMGSLVALLIVAVAPGNSIRLTYFAHQFGGLKILKLTTWYSVGFIARQILTHPLLFVVSLTLPLVLGLRDSSQDSKRVWNHRICLWVLLLTPAVVFVIIMCSIALGVYAMSVMLPERARILLSFVLVCGTLVWSSAASEYLIGRLLPQRRQIKKLSFVANLLGFLLVLFPLTSIVSVVRMREQARSFAVDWDRQDSELKAAKQSGISEVTVPQIGDFQSRIGKGSSDLHLRTDPTFWINRTVARYYGLTSVRANVDVTGYR